MKRVIGFLLVVLVGCGLPTAPDEPIPKGPLEFTYSSKPTGCTYKDLEKSFETLGLGGKFALAGTTYESHGSFKTTRKTDTGEVWNGVVQYTLWLFANGDYWIGTIRELESLGGAYYRDANILPGGDLNDDEPDGAIPQEEWLDMKKQVEVQSFAYFKNLETRIAEKCQTGLGNGQKP